jgi:uncharacterized protein (DUF1919 family)
VHRCICAAKEHRLLQRATNRCMGLLRRLYRKIWSRRLHNRNMTILSNNCCAGIMYHDLGQKFDSPTINLWIPDEYFFEFLDHLEYYVHAAPEQIFPEGVPYPVGRIKRGEKEIHLHFMHYESFSSACQKWLERGRRINPDHMYLVFNTTDTEYLDQFLALEYDHKVMLTRYDRQVPIPDNVIDMPVYKHSTEPGIILKYKSLISFKRWLDDFDYVSFLNQT